MNYVIYKYKIPLRPEEGLHQDSFYLDLPIGAIPLSVASQNNTPVLWAIVDNTESTKCRQHFVISVTGGPTSPHDNFLGTILLNEGQLVLHIFKRKDV